MSLLIIAGMPLLCLRASVAIADERRRGMLAPLSLAGIGPASLVWSKLKGALRPAVPLTAMVVIFWLADVGRMIGGFTEPRLWLASLAVLAAVGAGYFLAVSLGLLASAYAPSPRVALLAALGLLFAWDAAPQVVPQVVQCGLARDLVGIRTCLLCPPDRRRSRWSYQHPHGQRYASLTRFTRRAGPSPGSRSRRSPASPRGPPPSSGCRASTVGRRGGRPGFRPDRRKSQSRGIL